MVYNLYPFEISTAEKPFYVLRFDLNVISVLVCGTVIVVQRYL